LFAALTVVTIGDGKFARFWTSSWVEGESAQKLSPGLVQEIKKEEHYGMQSLGE